MIRFTKIFVLFLLSLFIGTSLCVAQSGVLKGIVLNEDNEAIEDVLVVVDGEWQILSDANGEFALPYKRNKEPEEIVAFLKGFKVKAWYYNPKADAVKLVLTHGNVMAGIVRDDDGNPIKNTPVHISGFETEKNLVTDKHGYFRLLLPEDASLHNAYIFKINNRIHNEHHYSFSPAHAFYSIHYSGIAHEEKKKESSHIQYIGLFRPNLKPIVHTPVEIDNIHYLTDPNGLVTLKSKVPKHTEFKLNGYTIVRSEFFPDEEKMNLIVNVEKAIPADTISKTSNLDKDFDIILKNLQKEKHMMLDNNALMNSEIEKIQERISKGDTLSLENKQKLQNLLAQIQMEAFEIHQQEEGIFEKRDNELIFNLQTLLLEKDSINKIVQARLDKVEKEKEKAEKEYQNKVWRMTLIGIFLLAIAIVGYTLALMVRKQKQQLAITNQQLEESKAHINQLYNEQTDGIKLALVTQQAILPPKTLLQEWIPEHFILYKPKDIVSGDFYWAEAKDGYFYFAVVDCTGHGVAGGFTSMLGYSLLNLALQSIPNPSPAAILDKLNEGVIRSLRQGTEDSQSKDGMDITLIKYKPGENKMTVAGGGNPVYIVRNNEVLAYKLDKFSIGIPKLRKDIPKFTDFDMEIQKNDLLYIFSDGYADQIGGEDGMQKFMYNRFRELLVSIHQDSFEIQKRTLDTTISEWIKHTEQLDDITVVGIKV